MENLLGTYLKQKRLAADLTQIQVARQLGQATTQYLSSIERGACEPSMKVLKQLGDIYSIPAAEFFDTLTEHRRLVLSKIIFAGRDPERFKTSEDGA